MNSVCPATQVRLSATVAAIILLAALGLFGNRSAKSQVAKTWGDPAPELVGGPWLNTKDEKPVLLADRKGKVILVHFWTFGCINCRRNLDAYNRLWKKYEKSGIQMIGIHTPETDEEHLLANVKKEAKALKIEYPVLVDEKSENWKRWGQLVWPTIWVIDQKGRIRYNWKGEFEWKSAGGEKWITARIDSLLAEK